MQSALEIRRLQPEHEGALAEFFIALTSAHCERYFHPHPFDADTARYIACYTGADLYFGALLDNTLLAYGMLRGWDAGYAIPSLGIAVRPSHQGSALGRTMMHFLHAAAQARGATQIRLTVDSANVNARQLYHSLGYEFPETHGPTLIGRLTLPSRSGS
jgi:ribosomal protein S18 acetylase RimI-like enzyme